MSSGASDPLSSLERRQESILDRLKSLQVRVDGIQAASGVSHLNQFANGKFTTLQSSMNAKLSHSIGFGTAVETSSSRRFKRQPTTYR